MPIKAESGETETIPVVEEHLRLEKRLVSKGKVLVKSVVDSIEELVKADLKDENVEITRVPIGRVVETVPQVRIEGDVTIIPVLQEEVVIEKRLILAEELHIRRHTVTETVEIPVTVRKQRVIVERVDSDSGPA